MDYFALAARIGRQQLAEMRASSMVPDEARLANAVDDTLSVIAGLARDRGEVREIGLRVASRCLLPHETGSRIALMQMRESVPPAPEDAEPEPGPANCDEDYDKWREDQP